MVNETEPTMTQEQEIKVYGMTVSEMKEMVENSILYKIGQMDMMVMGMMSDAQELVSYRQDAWLIEEQRRLLNRSKWVLRYYVMNREAA
jgi:hypothetical protein